MADKFKFYKIESWMVNDLDFETLHQQTLFAIIYGFKNHKFYGARKFLARLLMCDVRTVDRCLRYLQDVGYIAKLKTQKNYGDYKFKKTNTYIAIIDEENHPKRKNNEDILQFDVWGNIIIDFD